MAEPVSSVVSAAMLRWFNELSTQGIFTTDRDLRIQSWNAWLTRATGKMPVDVIGRHLFETDLLDRAFERYYQSALTGQPSMLAHRFHHHLIKIQTPSGLMAQSCRVAPLIEGDDVIGTLTVIDDVTERVNSESELRRQIVAAEEAREHAESALRAKDEFLATLSHELRTPLNAVLGWTNILLGGNSDAVMVDRALHVIERNAIAQARLIDDMLDMARIVTGKLRLDLSVVDVVSAASAAIDVVRPSATAKRITIAASYGGAPRLIQGDATRLQQIVWNVLSNAVKFTPAGGRIEVAIDEQDAAVRVIVSDTGKGIAAEFLPFVFDRFRQANSTMSRSEGGLGLGLALVRQLVNLHGGHVTAESGGADLGTRVTISFPSISPDDVVDAAQRKSRLDPSMLAGQRVLVVDDDPDWRDALSTALESLGASLATAGSTAEALEELKASSDNPFTVLVVDIGLPEEDGYALMQKVRRLGGDFATTPAIAVTAYAGVEHQRRALTSGFDLFRAKPVRPEDVAAAIVDVTRISGVPRPSANT